MQVPIHIPAFAGGPVPTFDLYEAYEAAAKAERDAAAATFDEAIKGSHLPRNGASPRITPKRSLSFRLAMLTCSLSAKRSRTVRRRRRALSPK